MIKERMMIAGIVSRAAFLRRMVTKGYTVNIDFTDINEMLFLLRKITNNFNQLSKRARETQSIYADDIDELRLRYDSFWDIANKILRGLAKIK